MNEFIIAVKYGIVYRIHNTQNQLFRLVLLLNVVVAAKSLKSLQQAINDIIIIIYGQGIDVRERENF